jgi:two-component system, OmpR family, sensor histidine kinase MtrB
MAPLTLRWRVALGFGLGSLLLTVVLAAVTWNLASGYMFRQREQSVMQQAEVNAKLVDASLRSGAGGLDGLLAGLTSDAESSVLVERSGGWVSGGRRVDPATLPDPMLAAARAGAPAAQRIVVDGDPVLMVGLPLNGDDAYIQLFSLAQLDRALRFLRWVLLAGVLISTLLAVVLGVWTSRRALRPLTELTGAASRVARGDLTARLPEHDDPDLAPLAATFNRTVRDLDARVQRDARFASDVSHELRSPLTTMANAAAVLERRRDEVTGAAGQALDLLLTEVRHFRRMVEDLLEISRDDQHDAGEQDREAIDLTHLVRNVVLARSGNLPRLEIERPSLVLGDRRRLDQVVTNLLDNADKYAGGPVRVGVLRMAGQVRIEVDDAGPGVPERFRERIFERFARGPGGSRCGAVDGSGLGLALVAQHAGRHGGGAWVEDRPGGGARFVVALPEARE